MGRRRIAAFVLVASAVACGDASFNGSTDAGDDASIGDASPDTTNRDANVVTGEDGGTPGNILLDPSFESGGPGCGAVWSAGNPTSTLSLSPIARTGSQSCLVCYVGANGGDGALVNNQAVAEIENPDAGIWEGTAWIMVPPPDAGLTIAGVDVFLYEALADGGNAESFGSGFVLNSTWQEAYVAARLGPVQALAFSIVGFPSDPDAGQACFLVDDVSLSLKSP